MNNTRANIDLVKMALYMLKRCWLIILCAAVGFGFMYMRSLKIGDTYTASGTMYVYNANPNLINYGYTNASDLSSAVRLVDTYAQVVKSNRVLDAIVERMIPTHPGLTTGRIAGSLSMGSVSETGVVRVNSRTSDPTLSADIVNTVLDVAPAEIKRVVGAGDIEIIDYASAPSRPDARQDISRGMRGALMGAVAAAAVLALFFLLNQKIDDPKELTEQYTLPVLASVRRRKGEEEDPGAFVLNDKSPMETIEAYAKLRMNLLYTLVGKESHSVAVVSAISGEGKSTIAANLAISLAMSGKKVLLVDADMRRSCQQDLFYYDHHLAGLSEILAGMHSWKHCLVYTTYQNLQVLPTGHQPPNPSELLGSDAMRKLLREMEDTYDIVLLDAPPINIVSDPLALSDRVAGALFVVRQDFSDHREVRKALTASEMTGMNLLGFVFYGERLRQGGYYSRKYYKSYYHKYDNRTGGSGVHSATSQSAGESGPKSDSSQPAEPGKPESPGRQPAAEAEADKARSANAEDTRVNPNEPEKAENAEQAEKAEKTAEQERHATSDRRRRKTSNQATES